QIDRVGRVEAVVGVAALEIDRGDLASGLINDDARSGHEQVIADGAKLARRLEPHIAVIKTGADHELIIEPEYFVVVGRLDRAADRHRVRRGAVERARKRATEYIRHGAGRAEQERGIVTEAQKTRGR